MEQSSGFKKERDGNQSLDNNNRDRGHSITSVSSADSTKPLTKKKKKLNIFGKRKSGMNISESPELHSVEGFAIVSNPLHDTMDGAHT